MRESSIVAAIVRRLRAIPGVWVRKTHGSRFSSGLPDLCVVAAGRSVWLEVKVPGKEPTALQRRTLEELAAAAAVVAVVTSADEGVAAVVRAMAAEDRRPTGDAA
jgi:hypothetical protein